MNAVLFVLWAHPHNVFVKAAVHDVFETVGFVQEDNQRDTISLVLSCLVTLGICVYSAVHLNLPARREPYAWILLRELKWCMVGLFAPELVLYTAWRQRASAKQLRDEIKSQGTRNPDDTQVSYGKGLKKGKTGSKSSYSTSEHSRSDWDMKHGFYATMGGIAIDIESDDDRLANIFGNATRLTLTAKGVSLLAACGRLPTISWEDIKDKNKTDSLSKGLVCVQAGWMVVQVIARRAYGLPITLLEVHTVAHVACALLMYVIWWHKPRQVEAPTLLYGDWVLPIAAYMYAASRMSGQRPQGALGRLVNPTPELKTMAYVEESLEQPAIEEIAPIYRTTTLPSTTTRRTSRGSLRPVVTGQSTVESRGENMSPTDDEGMMERRRLVELAISQYPAIRARFKADTSQLSTLDYQQSLIPYATELVQPHSMNWPNAGLLRRTQSLILGMVLWGASMLYGAIHVSAWDYFFPTAIEHLLWRLSSVWVTFCAAFWLMTNVLAHFFPFIDRVWIAFNERRLGWFGSTIIIVLCTLCGASFVSSRAFLVVEAFVSIRKVPNDVYITPRWSQIFPHL